MREVAGIAIGHRNREYLSTGFHGDSFARWRKGGIADPFVDVFPTGFGPGKITAHGDVQLFGIARSRVDGMQVAIPFKNERTPMAG